MRRATRRWVLARTWWRRRVEPGTPADCAEALAHLQAFLDGEIPADEADRVARHLEVCRACGLEAEAYRALFAALHRHGRPPASALGRVAAFAEDLAGGAPSRRA